MTTAHDFANAVKQVRKMRPIVTFTAGCAGSGKSYVLRQRHPQGLVIDPDAIKESLPAYDPEHPERVHRESSELASRAFYSALGAGQPFVMDGSGRRFEKLLRMVNDAHAAGFLVRILWVRAPLATCLKRNAGRVRKVPAETVVEMFDAVAASMAAIKPYTDFLEIVDNP